MEILSTTFFLKYNKGFCWALFKVRKWGLVVLQDYNKPLFFSSFFGGEITFEDLSFVGYLYTYLEVSTLLISLSFSIELK